MRTLRISFVVVLMAGLYGCGNPSDSGAESNINPVTAAADAGADATSDAAPNPVPGRVATQVDIIADQSGQAPATDPELVNAWGLAFNPKGAAWISANGSGLSPVYDSNGKRLLRVVVPPPKGGSPPSAPTGQVFNIVASSFDSDVFIFVTEDGTVSGWQPTDGTNAVLRVDNSDKQSVYKGVAITNQGTPATARLYAADFHNNKIDVYDGKYQPMHVDGNFTDPNLPAGYAPFNILAEDGVLFVSYALQDADKKDDVKGHGHGLIDLYDADGHLLQRLLTGGALNSPWGMAISDDNMTNAAPRLIVGNFGDGLINTYRLTFNQLKLNALGEGALVDTKGQPIVIDGLWALVFGPGAGGFPSDQLFFTAGPNDEQHGLFGKLVFQ